MSQLAYEVAESVAFPMLEVCATTSTDYMCGFQLELMNLLCYNKLPATAS